jgi:predicted regulator of Ras-like GTPase activity (Roadblock/LC7/MglB family)
MSPQAIPPALHDNEVLAYTILTADGITLASEGDTDKHITKSVSASFLQLAGLLASVPHQQIEHLVVTHPQGYLVVMPFGQGRRLVTHLIQSADVLSWIERLGADTPELQELEK